MESKVPTIMFHLYPPLRLAYGKYIYLLGVYFEVFHCSVSDLCCLHIGIRCHMWNKCGVELTLGSDVLSVAFSLVGCVAMLE